MQALGVEEFRRLVEAEWTHGRGGPATITQAEFDRVAAHFTAPAYETLTACEPPVEPAFARWVERNTHAHKVPGYAAVTLSLKPHGVAPGDITAEQMELVADLADRYSFGELRISHEQNIILADVRKADLYAVWQAARKNGLATANTGLLTGIICCPGGDFCDLPTAKPIPIATTIPARFDTFDYHFDTRDLALHISACLTARRHHHVGHLGALGTDTPTSVSYPAPPRDRQRHPCQRGRRYRHSPNLCCREGRRGGCPDICRFPIRRDSRERPDQDCQRTGRKA